MNTVHVVILLVVLCSAAAESGSGAISGSGEDDGDYATGKEGMSSGGEEVQKKSLQSGDSDISLDEDMDEFSSSGMEPSLTVNAVNNKHPSPQSTELIFSSWAKKTDKSRPMHMEEQKITPTVKANEKPAISSNPKIHPSLDLKDWKKKIKPKDTYLKQIRIHLKALPYENLSKTDNRSRHKHQERQREYRRGPSKDSHIEFAHVNKVIDEMEKLKKSKSDEEMAKKIRNGARKVMSSIAKKIVTKTTETLTPHLRNFLQSNLKKDHENEAVSISFLPKKHQKRTKKLLHVQVNQTKQTAVKPLNINPEMLKTESKQRGKTAKQEDFKKGLNVSVSDNQFTSMKNDKRTANVSTPRNISKHGTVNGHLKEGGTQNHAGQHEDSENGSHVIGKQRSNKKKGRTIGVKVILKTPTKQKGKILARIKKYKFMNKRTELITTPTPTNSIMLKTSRYDNADKLHQYVQGVLTSTDQVNKLQDKVHRLESEVTVLQTAFAGLVHRLKHMERLFQEVCNVTQSEVIYGTTLASPTTSPSQPLDPTPQPTPTVLFTSNRPSFPTRYNKRIPPTQHSTPTSQSLNYQHLVPGTFRENNLEPHQEIAGMVRPTIKPTSFIQQLQIEELPTKQRLTSPESLPFPLPPYLIQQLQRERLPTKQYLTSSKSPSFPAPSSIIPQLQMPESTNRQNLLSTKSPVFPEQFYMKVSPDSTGPESFHKQPLPKEEFKDRRHNVHQIIVPLETLYKMQAQEGISVPDNSYGESRDFDEADNSVSAPSNTILKDNTMKLQTPGNQHQTYPGMDIEQDDHGSEPSVRPIVNIIVPNSRTASILEKEMCWIPCKNGGKCNGRNTCQCQFPFHGNQCERRFSLYDFINAKANKGSVGSSKRNSMPRQKFQQISLKDLMQLGAKIRLTNDQVFGSAKKRLRKTKRILPVPRKHIILET